MHCVGTILVLLMHVVCTEECCLLPYIGYERLQWSILLSPFYLQIIFILALLFLGKGEKIHIFVFVTNKKRGHKGGVCTRKSIKILAGV